jgi:hypothetical protein
MRVYNKQCLLIIKYAENKRQTYFPHGLPHTNLNGVIALISVLIQQTLRNRALLLWKINPFHLPLKAVLSARHLLT